METAVFVLMILVCFSFLLKQTLHGPRTIAVWAAVCALFVGAMQSYAVEQSRTRIADWLADSVLMRDMAVLLSLEVVLQTAFCLIAVHVQHSGGRLRRRTIRVYRILDRFPGLSIFPVLFGGLVTAIFAFPGASFGLVAWSTAAGVGATLFAGPFLLRRLLPEREVRLELLFLSGLSIAVLGTVAASNGRTAATAENAFDRNAFIGVLLLTAVGAFAGMLLHRRRIKKTNRSLKS